MSVAAPADATDSRAGAPLALAAVSGAPALVYQVVWTRETALLAGSQVEAISAVLVAYFGGLALGARLLGRRADRVRRPLALYGSLEIGTALLAVAAGAVVWSARERGWALESDALLLALAAGLIAPVAFLLGGTLPALVRSAAGAPSSLARVGGWLVGANTAGAVAGVLASALMIPRLGLRATLLLAAALTLAVGLAGILLAPRSGPAAPVDAEPTAERAPAGALLAAAVAGLATLAYEVLAARGAALQLGSSLTAWALVLALFLAGLAVGNRASARRAAAGSSPVTDLGVVETGAAVSVAIGCALLVPDLAVPSGGLTASALLRTAAAVLPPACFMGAAFPLFVRLAAGRSLAVGARFGAVNAANTAGGIAGALLAPFVLLEALGLRGAILLCAALDLALAAAFLMTGAARTRAGALRCALALGLVGAASWPALRPPEPHALRRVLFAHDGRQASAVVVRVGGARELLVDGDPEASTAGPARRTEEMLAALALLLHPEPRRLLEVGLGSGITLATAARFPLERIEVVEIADSVLRASRFFAPDNDPVSTGTDPRLRRVRGDGRRFLAESPARYDVVLANTVHPWSLGATGLYSREYYGRMARALRPGGLAAQWIPAERIGASHLAAILRTFFAVFPEGGVWWGQDNLIAVGALRPIARTPRPAQGVTLPAPQGVPELASRRLADAAAVRSALGPGPVLSDDRPALEMSGRGPSRGGELALVLDLAQAGAPGSPLAVWLESRVARAEGDVPRANRLERRAENAGLALARRARIERELEQTLKEPDSAEPVLRALLREAPELRGARFALARILFDRGDLEGARNELRRLVQDHPDDAPGWNLLGVAEDRAGRRRSAREAFDRALEADPFLHPALANAGTLAVASGDRIRAREMLARLRASSPLRTTPEERALRAALGAEGG